MLMHLPRVLRSFTRDHPHVDLELRELASAPQLQLLADGALDAAFVATDLTISTPSVTAAVEWPDVIMLAVPHDHSLAPRQVIDPRTPIRKALGPLVLFPRDQAPSLHDGMLAIWRQLGGSTDGMQRAQTWPMIVSLVSAGMGSAIVPGAVRRMRVPGVHLIALRPPPRTIRVELAPARGRSRQLQRWGACTRYGAP